MAQDYERRLLRVIDHIHDHPAGDLSLDALAEVAALSRFHFHRTFRVLTGETVVQTVRRMRLHRAAVALLAGREPLDRIARSVGYPNRQSFSRAFAEAYGLPPARYRTRGELRPFSIAQSREVCPMPDVVIRTEPARTLAAMAHRGPYPEIGRAFEKLFAAISARGLLGRTGRMVGVYYDDPSTVPAANLRSHAGVEFPETDMAAPLEPVHLPAGRHAVLTVRGPYSGLPAAYDQLYAVWLPQSGEEPADSPPFEIYLNAPMDTPQEALLTEICIPLQRAA
jgi:AraC family transcriptional regulator